MQLTRDNEGEGWFQFCPPGWRSMGIAIKMTDRDVLEKAPEKFGGWSWDKQKMKSPHHKQAYTWKITERDKAYALLVAIHPFLGERRKAQIEKWVGQYRQLTPIEVPITHGTASSYNGRGCRCEACREACREAWRLYCQAQRAQRKVRNSAASPAPKGTLHVSPVHPQQ